MKTGMLFDEEIVKVVVDRLKEYKKKSNKECINLVVDPVMVSTSGSRLLKEDAIFVIKKELLPLALIVTPNIPEALVLSEMKSINSVDDMKAAAKLI